ncbi:MAG: deoxyribodipyrimidine photo-lyase, partial [Oligoflexus sp.]|nr:deoxyribodipyrimidine photo-lyase [Pseudopedobacter sp.]
MVKEKIAVFWFRRDLRLNDNAGLYHALKSGFKVLPIFIFDKNILDKLEDKDDARITFIYQEIEKIKTQIQKQNSSLLVKYGKPDDVWAGILSDYDIEAVYTNHDYEPYAFERDEALNTYFSKKDITFFTYKDQVVFEKSEIVKDDGKPYVVFTPYKRKWLAKLNNSYIESYPTEKYFKNFIDVKAYDLP